MVIFIVVMLWLALAESPSELVLVAFGILIRMAYMDFAFPKVPRTVYLIWIMIGVLTYAIGGQSADRAIMFFLQFSLSGILILHMSKRALLLPVDRLPYIGEIWLFFGRTGAILPAKMGEMSIAADQKVSKLRRDLAAEPLLIRFVRLGWFKISLYLRLVISLLHQMVLLVERQGAVLEARGQFPKEDYIPASERPETVGYASIMGDIFLCVLLAAPVILNDATLVPAKILQAVRSLWLALPW